MATYTSSHTAAHLRTDLGRRSVPQAIYDVRSSCVGTILSIVAIVALFVVLAIL